MASKPIRNPSMEISLLMVTAMIILSCSSNLLVVCQEPIWNPTWTTDGAQEAEVVAANGCSGHGRAYLDGLVLEGEQLPLCECNPCYSGRTCSQFISDCPANAASGDPYFLEPFWMNNSQKSAVLISGWHRMGYTYSDRTFISTMLVKYIKKMHELVGNAKTEDRFIIFGAGISQLLNAAVNAISANSSLNPAKVIATTPYYPLYREQTELFNSMDYRFEGDTISLLSRLSTDQKVIEFVTSPNNPDGRLMMRPALNGPNIKTIYDHAYYWPHFTPIPTPSDHEVMTFSLSKLTGHAGSRFGWAWVKDEAVYQRMVAYLHVNTIGVSRDSQLRALKLLNVVIEGGVGKEIFQFGYSTMLARWTKLRETLATSNRFSLPKYSSHYCTFFKRVRYPTPAYAWLKCEREEDRNCSAVMKAAKIDSHPGSKYSASDSYTRLSLIRTQDEFDLLIINLQNLVATP